MTEARKLKLSWQLKSIAALLVLTPVSSAMFSIFDKASLPLAPAASSGRGIASVSDEPVSEFNAEEASIDLSGLSNSELQKTFKYQILRDARATKFQDSVNVTMGLFYVRGLSGNKVYVCERFQEIEVTLTSSQNIQKTIKAPCNISDDQSHIEASVINFESSGNTQWEVTDVKLLGEKKDSLEVSAKDFRAVLGKELALEDVNN